MPGEAQVVNAAGQPGEHRRHVNNDHFDVDTRLFPLLREQCGDVLPLRGERDSIGASVVAGLFEQGLGLLHVAGERQRGVVVVGIAHFVAVGGVADIFRRRPDYRVFVDCVMERLPDALVGDSAFVNQDFHKERLHFPVTDFQPVHLRRGLVVRGDTRTEFDLVDFPRHEHRQAACRIQDAQYEFVPVAAVEVVVGIGGQHHFGACHLRDVHARPGACRIAPVGGLQNLRRGYVPKKVFRQYQEFTVVVQEEVVGVGGFLESEFQRVVVEGLRAEGVRVSHDAVGVRPGEDVRKDARRERRLRVGE